MDNTLNIVQDKLFDTVVHDIKNSGVILPKDLKLDKIQITLNGMYRQIWSAESNKGKLIATIYNVNDCNSPLVIELK